MDTENRLSYADKLRDPRWQKKRLAILSRRDFHCEQCGDGSSTLHVHHRRYIRGREPWEYDETDLVALCGTCHSTGHENKERLEAILATLQGPALSEAISILAGLLRGGNAHDEAYDLVLQDGWGSPRASEFGISARVRFDDLKRRTRFDAEDQPV